jgi:hypothetical protein
MRSVDLLLGIYESFPFTLSECFKSMLSVSCMAYLDFILFCVSLKFYDFLTRAPKIPLLSA